MRTYICISMYIYQQQNDTQVIIIYINVYTCTYVTTLIKRGYKLESCGYLVGSG